MVTPAPSLDVPAAELWLSGWREAWDRLDPDAVAACCTDDLIWRDPSLPEPLHGLDAARTFFAETVSAFPDLVVDHVQAPCYSLAEPLMTVAYEMAGTMLGPWESLGVAATGRSMRVGSLDEYRFRDGLLAEVSTTYDSLEVARQLGLLPPSGGRLERVLTRAQHLGAWVQRRQARAAT
jgi:steroid delta-isomerase-like uncharacterized protein